MVIRIQLLTVNVIVIVTNLRSIWLSRLPEVGMLPAVNLAQDISHVGRFIFLYALATQHMALPHHLCVLEVSVIVFIGFYIFFFRHLAPGAVWSAHVSVRLLSLVGRSLLAVEVY